MKKTGVLVVGSANMDLVVKATRFPRPGETLFGNGFGMFPGGKGANQAVACAKLGARTILIAKIGNDIFGDRLADSMKHDGVCLDHVLCDPAEPTGIALITVDGGGENKILVVPGSNMKLTPGEIDTLLTHFAGTRTVLLQLEIPLATVTRTAVLARAAGATVILNPAPACRLSRSLLGLVDYLTPNEHEAELLSGLPVHSVKSGEKAARRLLRMGVKNVILTLGERGALLVTAESAKPFPAVKVKAVDTTAAGDAFNGALAFALSTDARIDEAIRFANAVGAMAVTQPGAQSSLPTMRGVRTFLRKRRLPLLPGLR